MSCAIVLDQEILSVPVIEDVIRDSGQIRGAGNREEAEDLAVNLHSGALPAGDRSSAQGRNPVLMESSDHN